MSRGTKQAVRRKATNNNIEDAAPVKRIKRSFFDQPPPQRSNVLGLVLVCGQGDMGQLGLGEDEMERKKPVLIPSAKNVVEVCAGGMHNLYLTTTGELYSFGCNDEGALGRDTSEEGSDFVPKKVDLPGKGVKICAGDSHSACLLEDGRVFAWGSFRDSHGNMGLTLDGNKRAPIEVVPGIQACDIASGADHLVILTSLGKVYTVGCGEQGQLGRVSLRSASGESRRGKNELLQPGLVMIKGRKSIEAIWATTYCTFLREHNTKTIWAFGLNNYKQIAYPKNMELIINPVNTKFTNVKKIAGGQHHTLVLTNDKKCYAIGRHDYGRLGLGDIKEDVTELKEIDSLKNIVDIACGESTSFALTEDGKLYAWGFGSNLQLGTGSEDDSLEPAIISSKALTDARVIRASGGGQHSIFLIEDTAAPKQKAEKVTENKKKAAVENKEEPVKNADVIDKAEENNVKNTDKENDEVKPDVEVDAKPTAAAKKGRKKK